MLLQQLCSLIPGQTHTHSCHVLIVSNVKLGSSLMGDVPVLSTVELCTLIISDVEQQVSRSADACVSQQACAA